MLRQINPYVKDLVLVGSNSNEELIPTVSDGTQYLGVAGFTSDVVTGNISYRFSLKDVHGRAQQHTIDGTSSHLEPLSYPLFFPFGERGWYSDLQKQGISFMMYLSARILMPEPELEVVNNGGHNVFINRFQAMSRAMQFYIVERMCDAHIWRSNWHKKNQNTIFGATRTAAEENIVIDEPDEFIDPERVSYNNSSPSFLAESFTGSPRHLKSLALNALTIVSELDRPTVFITGTVNPKWPEIAEMLLPGQTVYDRPDVVSRVFHARVEAIMANLR